MDNTESLKMHKQIKEYIAEKFGELASLRVYEHYTWFIARHNAHKEAKF